MRGADPALWRVVSGGWVRVDAEGQTRWEPAPDGRHAYVRIACEAARIAAVIGALMIAPPRRG